jgi:uncharacterized protein
MKTRTRRRRVFNKIYLDTSAYLKAYLDEPGSNNVNSILDLNSQGTKSKIYMSYWVIIEALGAIYRQYRYKSETLAPTILKLVVDAKPNIIVVYINQNSIEETIGYISKYHLRAGDALHLCIANKFHCNYFITADQDFMDLRLNNLHILNILNDKTIDNLLEDMQV